ncbi:methyltransferase family protein [Winogradskyella pacifica]|uniref:Methyltransferase family protein n=1 Tax=Winogradskyella pacifica TaxID=664642 RepID=A0A3D9MZA3_9FLAO|nr:class I SAM-dependent methyltransferase [Winogradskyella pacifica]REE24468.1 methyltransferase family protein [Winogradskyella pacifica]
MNIRSLIKNPNNYIQKLKCRITRFVRVYKYSGDTVTCENCLWLGQFFFNGECPKCKSLPRTRLIPFSIDYFKLKSKNLSILHVAPNLTEYNGVQFKLEQVKQYDRLDIKPIKHVNLIEDLSNLTLNDESYDLAIIWHVFEHIEEDLKAISEVYRVLRPGGKLLMSVPIYPNGNLKTFEDKAILYKDYGHTHGHYDHCRSCGLDYYKRFESFGFSTETLNVNALNDDLILKYGLSKGHTVWCFTK